MKTKLFLLLPMLVSLVACSSPSPSGGNSQQGGETKIHHGQGAPSDSLGEDFHHYYDETSRQVYEKKDGHWMNQFAIGSSALFSVPNTKKARRANEGSQDLQKLKDALMMSFYSTNITCFMKGYMDDPDAGSWVYVKADGRNFVSYDRTGTTPTGYVKVGEDGKTYLYDQETSEYVENLYMAFEMPSPTFDNLVHQLTFIYDDDLGEQTSIVCGNLSKAVYDDETGYYEIDEMSIHHDAATTLYVTEPMEDDMTLSFKFKLSQDETYVTNAEIKIVSSVNLSFFEGMTTSYEFSNLHTTVVEMPE